MTTLRTIVHAGILTAFCTGPAAASDTALVEHTDPGPPSAAAEIVLASDLGWEPLNPARGDASPRAATLWGDRKADVPTGFLVAFADGFSSPPHIHNVSYRGVVISGGIHNDDPGAARLWMPTASFWTQPKGEVHITAAQGSRNLAYIEIDDGPYLVMPPEDAYDSGERPVNVATSNLVWLDASEPMPSNGDGARMAYLWGSTRAGELRGALVELPPGFGGTLRTNGTRFRAVVIDGHLDLQLGESDIRTLEPGSYWGTGEASTQPIASAANRETILYVRTNGEFEIVPEAHRD